MEPTQIGASQWLYSNIGTTNVHGRSVELHAIAEIVNMEEAVGGKFDHPYTVDVSILPDSKHLSQDVIEDVTDTHGAETDDYEPFMLYGYGYHIPVNTEDTTLGCETQATNNLDFTVEGNNACFDSSEDAEEYITSYVPLFFEDVNINACLSKQVNKAGDTGYSVLQTICSE